MSPSPYVYAAETADMHQTMERKFRWKLFRTQLHSINYHATLLLGQHQKNQDDKTNSGTEAVREKRRQ